MNAEIYGEASDWVVKHRSGRLDAQETRAFDDWLRASPLHVGAYLEMSSVWENLGELDPGWNPDAETLVARGRADDGVVPFVAADSANATVATASMATAAAARATRSSAGRDRAGEPRIRRRSSLWYALAASVLVAAVSLAWLHFQQETYATGVGEQRSLTLADGSTIVLNARSRIKVKYTEAQRNIELAEGQALFQVAKNPQRPFVVRTGDVQVRAVGTAFDVRRARSGTVVTVVEGRVAVHAVRPLVGVLESMLPGRTSPDGASPARKEGGVRPAPAPIPAPVPAESVRARSGETLLDSGEQVVVTAIAMTAPRPANMRATLAWTQGNLVLATVPLPEVAEELNRYSRRPLVIQDPALADFNVSGVFSMADTTLLLQFLRAQPELVVEETEDEIRLRRR